MGGNIETATGSKLQAVILDLDGVITRTAELHSAAWKEMFDTFLCRYADRKGTVVIPLDRERDYREYIDGRPRYEGAQAFLESRSIDLPFGSPGDDSSKETVCGLGNKKNEIYRRLLHDRGPKVFHDTIDSIKKWRNMHIKTAVISASKNCREVLSKAGITGLFDTVVDGSDSVEHNIKGKPEPDIFLFAARALNVEPSFSAIIEDSSAGVKAGRKGKFAYVIGVSRSGNYGLLYRSGADIVVSSLEELPDISAYGKRFIDTIPGVMDHFDDIVNRLHQKKPLLVLDYDGTLTPIVGRPEQAILSEETRRVVDTLAKQIKVAIVSGRDLETIKCLINLDNIYYAGSHGFDIYGPDQIRMEPQAARSILPDLDSAEQEAKTELSDIQSIQMERKKFMLAVHYRNVGEEKVEHVHTILEQITNRYNNLTMTLGKKVFEIRPAINWHKGKAVAWITDHLSGSSNTMMPLYIGDDITDEDAFRAVKGNGISILVGNHGERSCADYRLSDTDQVLEFLKKLSNELNPAFRRK